jgi:uncharacterized protein (DUF1800 family)
MKDQRYKNFIVLLIFCTYYNTFIFAQPSPQLIGIGKNSNITVTTSNTSTGTSGRQTLSNEGFLPNNNAASRFLSQASFGGTFEEIMALSDLGFEDWIEQQFALPIGFSASTKVSELTTARRAGLNDQEAGPLAFFSDYAYWEYAMTSPDLLRQRVALALSEILVISTNSSFGGDAYAFAAYYDLLLNHSFGNYRDLLEAVTFNSAMGVYLTYMNNPKQDTTYDINTDVFPPDTLSQQVIFPDENYAREVMQLFSIGLCELNIDGTCKVDSNGVPIPTYDNVDIAEFSKIFTGLTWVDPWCDFGCIGRDEEQNFIQPMVMNNEYHEPGPKNLLNGHVVQPRNPVDGVADIREALDNLFNHPNVGPFLGKFLIQRLVTSNPSPAYVTRVSRAFNGESHYGNQRGDLKAVIKAILLDDEARNCAAQNDPNFGKLREPFIRYLQLCHSFDLQSVNNVNRNVMRSIYQHFGQKPFASPSVFNFFQSDYQPIGPIEQAGKVAPEFQITNTQSISGYMNALNRWTIYDDIVEDWGRGYEEPYDENDRPHFDFSDEFLLTDNDKLPELLDRLDLILAHGRLSQRSKDAIRPLLEEMPTVGWNEESTIFLKTMRIRMAIYLIMSSPEYLISR